MNIKNIILLGFLFIINFVESQILHVNKPFNFPDSTGNILIINTQYISQSNSFSYPFIHHFIRNKYISEQVKDNNPFKDNVLAQYEWLNSIHFYHLPDSIFGTDNTGIHFSTSYKQWFSLLSKSDLIKMILYGNKPFAGKEINFNSTKLNYFNFFSLTFGLFKNYFQKSFLLKAIFDVNFHIFKDIQYFNIPKGSIFTDKDGTYIDVFLNGTYQASKQYNPGLSFNMGLQWKHFDSKTTFSFQVYQLGYCKLNKKSNYARIDTNICFEGFEIQNVLIQPTFQSGLFSSDSLAKYYKSFLDTNYSYLRLPEIMRFYLSKKWQSNILRESYLAITYVHNSGQSIPEFSLSQCINLKRNVHINFGTSFFGFSHFNPFLSINYMHKKNLEIHLFYSNPLSYLSKKYPFHNGIQLLVKKVL